jgi:hypothetical protein
LKLDVINWLEKGKRIVDVCCNVRLAHSTICAICDNDDEIEVLCQEIKCLCSKTTTVLLEWTVPKTVDVGFLHFNYIQNKYIV